MLSVGRSVDGTVEREISLVNNFVILLEMTFRLKYIFVFRQSNTQHPYVWLHICLHDKMFDRHQISLRILAQRI